MLARLLLASLAAAIVAARVPAADPPRRPDIVLILADDMGYSDIGCYGGEISTPNLDRLAAGGVRWTGFYNTARCCPTRAALLTGLYPHRAGVGHMMEDKGSDGYRGDLDARAVTIAEALRPAGYRSYAVGKWHVTRHAGPDGPRHNWPLARGFDRFYGTITGGGSYWDPPTLTRDDRAISPFADPEYRPETYYYTDAISDQAARCIAEHRRDFPERPFFLYLAYTAAHWPMHAHVADIERQRGKYDGGYDAIRRARYEKGLRLGTIDPAWRLGAAAEDWPAVGDRRWEARCMEVYAAMVERMDAGIGKILEAIERTGGLDRTAIFYLQDNGGCAEVVGRSPDAARPAAPTLPPIPAATLRQEVIPAQTREGFPVLGGKLVDPGPPDTFIAYGRGWANVSNTPLREYKHWVHEGGISSPLIVHWPGGIPAARRGSIERQPAHVIDVLPTCLDLAGAPYPRERGGERVHPLAGISLRPALEGRALERAEPLFWEHEGNRAVRAGKWKLVARGPAGPWELYDVEVDRSETEDLASREPERVRAMAARWEAWARRDGVLPWIWKPPYGEGR